MSIDINEVRHLAELSEISLTTEELTSLTADIDNIVNYINMLNELDTDDVEPTFQLTGQSNIWREDEVKPQLPREQLLALAPEQQDNQVKVAKVL